MYPHLRRLDLTINHHLYVVLVLGYGHRWAAITITTVPRMIGQTPSEFLRLSVCQGDKDWILGFPWEHTHPQQDDSHGKS
eukprot:COSAG01_NODE_18537_length_1069_cov_2.817526_1_plen_80_part_00